MQKIQPPVQAHVDEIDLRQLVGMLWRQRVLIASFTIASAVLSVGASFLSTRYVSDGLFLTPGVSTASYKRFESVFTSGPRLRQFLLNTNQISTADGALLHELADTPGGLKQVLKPEFAFTDKDQKTFGVKVAAEAEAGAMIGVRIEFKHKEPTQAGLPQLPVCR
jgi:LPS O-antigen subunit length determinant protein (WzzB/FepE family)